MFNYFNYFQSISLCFNDFPQNILFFSFSLLFFSFCFHWLKIFHNNFFCSLYSYSIIVLLLFFSYDSQVYSLLFVCVFITFDNDIFLFCYLLFNLFLHLLSIISFFICSLILNHTHTRFLLHFLRITLLLFIYYVIFWILLLISTFLF